MDWESEGHSPGNAVAVVRRDVPRWRKRYEAIDYSGGQLIE
jgi:hypothetical protein